MTTDALLQRFPKIKVASWRKRGFFADLVHEVENFLTTSPIAKAKPFIKWVGGKRQLLAQYQKLYPLPDKFDIENNTYFEPFVGGGAVFFDIQPYNAVLSDVNEELITTYQVIKECPEELIKSLKKHKYEKEYYLSVRAKQPQNLSKVEIAARFIYLNRTGFNGLYRVNSKGEFNVPFGRYNNPVICDEVNLRNVHQLLKNVQIAKRDYKDVLKHANKGDFVYFDPPYYPVNKTSSFTSYTAGGFLEKEQIELRDTFNKLHKKGCFVMLSNSDTPFIRKIYSEIDGAKIHTVYAGRAVNSAASKRGKVSEIVVYNYV